MSKENAKDGAPDIGTANAPAKAKTSPVAESAAEDKQVKNWQFWVTKLGADYPLARGACADLKADWDAAIGEKEFKAALEKFGGQTFGAKSAKRSV